MLTAGLETAPDLPGGVLNADPLRSGEPASEMGKLVRCRGGCAGNAVSGLRNAKTFTRPQAEIYYAKRARFQLQRRRIAAKLKNPRLLQITFHTFRHWKATMEYHKTRDILHVMHILGHRSIQNTLIYTQLIGFDDDEYVAKVASSEKEVCQLIESGFEYVCDYDGNKVFRKRK